MASNDNVKMFGYIEGLSASEDFPKTLAKVLALGVQQDAVTDDNGNIISPKQVLPKKNWHIVYPAPKGIFPDPDSDECSPDDYVSMTYNQLAQIKDHVIMKTTVTPKMETDNVETIEQDVLDLSGNDSITESKAMYLEIYKPTYIANPEQYTLDCELDGIVPKMITKDLYEKSYIDHIGYEEELNENFPIERVINGSVPRPETREHNETAQPMYKVSYDDANAYLEMINTLISEENVLPSMSAPLTISIPDAYLANIKLEQVDLYTMICNQFTSIAEFDMLRELVIEFTCTREGNNSQQTEFTIHLKANVVNVLYSIKAGTEFRLQYLPIDTVVPELYKQGKYIPIENKYYSAEKEPSGKYVKVKFKNNYEYDKGIDGILVVRYEYHIDISENNITERESLRNNHYILLRLFDTLNEKGTGPMANVYDLNGEIVVTNSRPSPWVKLSWYQDFEEVMIDTIDSDTPINTVADGSVFVPLVTPGLSGDTKLQFWINTNNDRFILMVMGNASLDYSRDRHLISSCYCGAIDSFEGSIDDVSGNFALYASSSTEPCKTKLETEKILKDPIDYVLSAADLETMMQSEDRENDEEWITFRNFFASAYKVPATGDNKYNILITDENVYFNEKQQVRCMFVSRDTNEPVTPLFSPNFSFIERDDNGRSQACSIENIPAEYVKGNDCWLVVNYGSYKEKIKFTPGVTRDIFGNVLSVKKEDMYGVETSDGITSVMMYHSRSKNYYQKHRFLFATTEEYMSRSMYGKSRYTDEYYADRIKLTHSNDGPRGILSDLLVIDSSSLQALDELVINKDFKRALDEKEETFIYFPITAPYSPLSDGPNARYGLAIKKSEVNPKYDDEESLVNAVLRYIDTVHESLWYPTESNIYPPVTWTGARDNDGNTADVYWRIINTNDGTSLDPVLGYGLLPQARNELPERPYELDDNDVPHDMDYEPLRIVVTRDANLRGVEDSDNAVRPFSIMSVENVEDYSGQNVAVSPEGYVMATNIASVHVKNLDEIPSPAENEEQSIFYGYGIADDDDEISYIQKLGENAQLKCVKYDNDRYQTSEKYEYGIEGIPFVKNIEFEEDSDILNLIDAAPDKLLIIYKYQHTITAEEEKYNILKFGRLKLTRELLNYPCTVVGIVKSGSGTIALRPASGEAEYKKTFSKTCEYNQTINLLVQPDEEWAIGSVEVIDSGNNVTSIDIHQMDSVNGFSILLSDDITINVKFIKQ